MRGGTENAVDVAIDTYIPGRWQFFNGRRFLSKIESIDETRCTNAKLRVEMAEKAKVPRDRRQWLWGDEEELLERGSVLLVEEERGGGGRGKGRGGSQKRTQLSRGVKEPGEEKKTRVVRGACQSTRGLTSKMIPDRQAQNQRCFDDKKPRHSMARDVSTKESDASECGGVRRWIELSAR